MSENKNKPTTIKPEAFIEANTDAGRRHECQLLLEMMSRITGEPPRMWGDSMIGFGQYHYKYESGREGDFFLAGFAPRKQNLSIYIMPGLAQYEGLMTQLGKYKTGVSCLYVKRLADIDLHALESLISASVEWMRSKYPAAQA